MVILKDNDFIELSFCKEEVDCILESLDYYYKRLIGEFLPSTDIKQRNNMSRKLYILEDLINEIGSIRGGKSK